MLLKMLKSMVGSRQAEPEVSEPETLDDLNARAIELAQSRRYDEALQLLDQALQSPGDHAGVWSNVGNVLQLKKQHAAAWQAYLRAVEANPGNIDFWLNAAHPLESIRDWVQALNWLATAHQKFPSDERPLLRMLSIYRRLGQVGQALDVCKALSSEHAHKPDALTKVGIELCLMKEYEQSAQVLTRAASIHGKLLDLQANEEQQLAQAEEIHDAELCMGIGLWFMGASEPDRAVIWMERALRIDPGSAQVHLNLALVHQKHAHTELTKHHLEAALRIDGESPEARFNYSLHLLQVGDFERGWAMYESRWEQNQLLSLQRPNLAQPLWLGQEDMRRKTLLIQAEQGLGDAIMFVRYVRQLNQQGIRVLLQVQPPLHEIMQASFDSQHTRLYTEGDAFDAHIPIMSLPLAMGTCLETIPAELPYLYPRVSVPSRDLSVGPLRVGVIWAGSALHANDAQRSIALAVFSELFAQGIQWVALQKEINPTEAEVLKRCGVEVLGPAFESFADTADAIAGLDLVISVDTSVAHLSAAMGKPTWILLAHSPDFRWLLDRDDSPWYPGVVRLFRQDARFNWLPVMEQVRVELSKLSQQGRAPSC